MQWTGLNELREKYLSFFESKGHLRLDSFPLVPKNDPSLLLINSGMAPMKKWFLAQEEPPRHRVTTCQKCIRTPDIERVGITARHGTFFEMLGNFSFQDYFKEEVIPWAWEFLTSDEWMAIPKDRLHISVYEEDDEAYDIWTKKVGIAPDHMVRLGKEDNFWEHGSGPCGPCSEIYFDRGPEYGCGKPTCGVGCDCDRYMEIWNLVFSQFDADGKGHYERLARPNIDTGMGLERLACVMQGVGNLFEVDTVQSVLHHVEHIANKTYGEDDKNDISIRVITDHIRSCTFMVSDGILPSNEGRGYVLRRLLRRAARHGRMLGITRPFLVELAETVIQSSDSAYPELREHDAYIKKVIGTEEANFARTIDAGMNILNNMIDGLEKAHQHLLKGLDVFKLNDTFGFPLDLTKEIAAEAGLGIDEAAFYGPKLDIQYKNVYGKEDTLVTIQIDMLLAHRFGMYYTDTDGQKKLPYIIHRTSLGCYERTLAYMIEHFAGAMPLWIAPEQVRLIPIADRHLDYTYEVLRCEVDSRAEKVGYKIRQAVLEKVPYMITIGDNEVEQKTVAVRSRKNGDLGSMQLDDLLAKLKEEVDTKAK